MKKLLNQKEQWYEDTAEQAEEIVTEAKESEGLVKHAISEKHNKYGTYHLVDLQFSYNTPRELMEDEAAKKEREKENDDPQHEGVPYEVSGDGTVSVNNQEDEE
ncbi:organic solvent tolerance protein OstA [Lysinibacillus pakistanensis]|uniref:organic solvent tolerance protein OstA n=1 Tax=Lysinibacillus pakistanensis TaxID=759811 RepID=UPI003D2DDAE1